MAARPELKFFLRKLQKKTGKKTCAAQLSHFRKTPSNVIYYGINSAKLTVDFENRGQLIFHHLRQFIFHGKLDGIQQDMFAEN